MQEQTKATDCAGANTQRNITNKSLTRDNLAKRRHVDDLTCVFCNELESIQHLFFDCIVAKNIWGTVAEIVDFPVPCSFSDLAIFWKQRKIAELINIFSAAILWGLWLLRNDIVFQGRRWRSVKCIQALVGSLVHSWKVLCVGTQATRLLECLRLLDRRHEELLRIAWH